MFPVLLDSGKVIELDFECLITCGKSLGPNWMSSDGIVVGVVEGKLSEPVPITGVLSDFWSCCTIVTSCSDTDCSKIFYWIWMIWVSSIKIELSSRREYSKTPPE